MTLAAVAAGLCAAGPAAGQTQVPEAPHLWSVASLDEALRLYWWAVTGADSYDVRWKSPGESYDESRLTEDIEATEGLDPPPTYFIRGLTNGTLYTVQVRASNSAGKSGWSNELAGRPTRPPDAPVLRATPGDRSIVVTWDAVPDAHYYQLIWSREGDSELDAADVFSSTSHTIENADFDVTNATVTGVENWGGDSGVYRVNVTPTTLGEPVTIGLPANRVKGVGEGISSSGGNTYTRDNTASNTVVQETAAPGSRGARSGVAADGRALSASAAERRRTSGRRRRAAPRQRRRAAPRQRAWVWGWDWLKLGGRWRSSAAGCGWACAASCRGRAWRPMRAGRRWTRWRPGCAGRGPGSRRRGGGRARTGCIWNRSAD